MATALRHAGLAGRDPFAPGSLFSLSRPGRIDALFHEAGFRDVATTAVDAVFRMPTVDDYLAFVRSSASPCCRSSRARRRPPRRPRGRTSEQLLAFDTPAGWEGPNELLLTAARRPGGRLHDRRHMRHHRAAAPAGHGGAAAALVPACAGGAAGRCARDRRLRLLCSGPAGSIPDLVARAWPSSWP
jgi:hypothetical protein